MNSGESCIWVLCFSTAIQASQDYPRLFMFVHRHSLVSCFLQLISFRAHFAGKIWNDRDRNGSVQSLAWIKITGKTWWLFSCILRSFIKHFQQGAGNLFCREEKCLWTELLYTKSFALDGPTRRAKLSFAWCLASVKPLIMEWYSTVIVCLCFVCVIRCSHICYKSQESGIYFSTWLLDC